MERIALLKERDVAKIIFPSQLTTIRAPDLLLTRGLVSGRDIHSFTRNTPKGHSEHIEEDFRLWVPYSSQGLPILPFFTLILSGANESVVGHLLSER